MMNRALFARAMACGVCLAAFAPVQASADIYDMVFSDVGGYSRAFQVDTDNIEDYGSLFLASQGAGYSAYFYDTDSAFSDGYSFEFDGNGGYYLYRSERLFSGSTANPSFTPGLYQLVGDNRGLTGATGTLRILAPGGAAPGGAAPEVGLGLLSLLAAAAALAFTRLRMPLLRRAAA